MSKKKSDGECLAAKRTFVGRSPRPCERAEQAEPERSFFMHQRRSRTECGKTSRVACPKAEESKSVSEH